MRRYFGEEQPEDEEQFQFEDGFDDYDDEDEGEEGNVAYIDSEGLVDLMHMDLAQTELNQDLLSKAIDLAKQSFFWRFRSTASRLKEIREIYRQLIKMTDEDEESEE